MKLHSDTGGAKVGVERFLTRPFRNRSLWLRCSAETSPFRTSAVSVATVPITVASMRALVRNVCSHPRVIIRSAVKRSTTSADALRKRLAEKGNLEKILERDALIRKIQELKQSGQKIVFTNGCFDILHPGHIHYLQQARRLGDALVVGVNSDRSVRELKGPQRPILTQLERCVLLAGLESVSYVTVFDEPTPLALIQSILPHLLVKGGDWGLNEIVGREEVEAGGGMVTSLPYENGQSTSGIIERILSRYRP